MLLGNAFQSLGAASRKDLRLDFCMTRRLFEEDLRCLVGEKHSGRSTMYFEAMSFIALHLRSSILYAIRCLIGCQCN